MEASISIFPAVFTGLGDEVGGVGGTYELMAFCCVLQAYSLARIVLCFPEDTSQMANVN